MSRISKTQYFRKPPYERDGYEFLAQEGFVVTPLQEDYSAAANIDMLLSGDYWELKTLTGGGGKLRSRLTEGISKWTRLEAAGEKPRNTPSIVVDNRFSTATDDFCEKTIRESQKYFNTKGIAFDKAMLITSDGRIIKIQYEK